MFQYVFFQLLMTFLLKIMELYPKWWVNRWRENHPMDTQSATKKPPEKELQDKHLKNRSITPSSLAHFIWKGNNLLLIEVMFLKKLLRFFEAKKGWCLSLFAAPNPHK